MSSSSYLAIGAGVFAFAGVLPVVSSAALIQETYFSATSQTEYDPSGTSLIRYPSSTLSDLTFTPPGLSGVTQTIDGNKDTFFYHDGEGYSLTYTLNTTVNTAGYDILSTATISGWGGTSRPAQQYTITYTTVDNDTVVLTPTAVHGTQASAGSLKIVLRDSDNDFIATGVKSITFNIQLAAGNGAFGTIYRELEVEGTPTPIPEPAALSLLGVVGFALLNRRRTR